MDIQLLQHPYNTQFNWAKGHITLWPKAMTNCNGSFKFHTIYIKWFMGVYSQLLGNGNLKYPNNKYFPLFQCHFKGERRGQNTLSRSQHNSIDFDPQDFAIGFRGKTCISHLTLVSLISIMKLADRIKLHFTHTPCTNFYLLNTQLSHTLCLGHDFDD